MNLFGEVTVSRRHIINPTSDGFRTEYFNDDTERILELQDELSNNYTEIAVCVSAELKILVV